MNPLICLFTSIVLLFSNTAFSKQSISMHLDSAIGIVDYNIEDDYEQSFENPKNIRGSVGLDFCDNRVWIELIGQQFGHSKAHTRFSGPGIGNDSDVFKVNAEVSAAHIGIGGRIQLPVSSHVTVGGKAGMHFWRIITDETVNVSNSSGTSTNISGPVEINGKLYGGGKIDDKGVYGYGCLNMLYRWNIGFYSGFEYGFFPMNLTGGEIAKVQTFSFIIGYSH